MRDASTEDMAAFWIGRMIEQADWPPSETIYLAIIRHAATRLFEEHEPSDMWFKIASDLEKILAEIQERLSGSDDYRPMNAALDSWGMPFAIRLQELNPEQFEKRYAHYWSTNWWRSDFLSSLESQFWAYKEYAHGAGKGKMAFLRAFAEIWITAATTALVRYAEDDKRVWRATANMLRRHADMVEADGLRAIPWGAWGHMRGEPSNEPNRGSQVSEQKASGTTT